MRYARIMLHELIQSKKFTVQIVFQQGLLTVFVGPFHIHCAQRLMGTECSADASI